MISKKEVEHVAQLARLGLSDNEIKEYQKELSQILDYIEKLGKADISDVIPTSHALEMKNVSRKDEPDLSSAETVKKLLEAAPDLEDNYIKVKSILK
ncbi:MAG: Asp-tRNA(Asn)/Glu-tRNA(Gln) amidotransferase subunit GatC [Candidatus Pacebacteria bacterium]|nr:Asp-tRNA(Asn)/Glu-tRNA(Gln) amidotransferase subunit GatC [Candidatus Paceibacterota bacterium]